MALIDRQVRDRIVSRGLGNGPEGIKDNPDDVVIVKSNIKAFVYRDKFYYPTTGVFSREEPIKGWHWDRTTAQEKRSNKSRSKEITDFIGGYKYNLLEGTKQEDYRGSIINGCELKEIEEVTQKKGFYWNPILKTGSYSLKGIDKPLYSSTSINKIFQTAIVDLSEYAFTGNLDNITVAIYKRDKFLIKTIFRQYEENNIIYKYSVDESTQRITINTNRVLNRNSSINAESLNEDIFKSLEKVGSYNSGELNRKYYSKYFPIIDVSVYVNKEKVADDKVKIDRDLGIIVLDSLDISGEVRIAYNAVPRVDFEMQPEIGFKSKLDIKPHNYKQSNGLIEITCEERHVSRLILTSNLNGNALVYGSDSAQLTALALNSLNQVVDEIPVTFKSLDTSQEVFFEGNLLENVTETNSDGEAYSIINAPLSSEASSYSFPGNQPEEGFVIPQGELTFIPGGIKDHIIIFEVLACDPFYGSKGLTLNVTSLQEDPIEGWYFEIETNLESQDYKLFRNALSKSFVKPINGADCFEVFYNSGFAKLNGNEIVNSLSYKAPIKRITKNKIYINGVPPVNTFTNITLFQKNSNYNLRNEPKGVERVLYQSDGSLLRPNIISNGHIKYEVLDDRENDDLVVGYRICVPRATRLQASCIDPATGNTITSDVISINVDLPSIYKDVITLHQDDSNASALDIMNFISYDAVDNNFYFEGSNQ